MPESTSCYVNEGVRLVRCALHNTSLLATHPEPRLTPYTDRSKQSTLMGFFGQPKPGSAPARPGAAAMPFAAGPNSSPASTSLRTPFSAASSSPLNASSRAANGVTQIQNTTTDRTRGFSPLKRSTRPVGEDGDEAEMLVSKSNGAAASSDKVYEEMDVDEVEEEQAGMSAADGSPVVVVSLPFSDPLTDFPAVALRFKRLLRQLLSHANPGLSLRLTGAADETQGSLYRT